MSLYEDLRRLGAGPDYRNREKMLQETARKCTAHFADHCERWACAGEDARKELAHYEWDCYTFSVLVFEDDRYEAGLREEENNIYTNRRVCLRESECGKFRTLLREELAKRGLDGVAITKKAWPALRTNFAEYGRPFQEETGTKAGRGSTGRYFLNLSAS